MRSIIAAALICLGSGALAECPVPDRSAERAALLEDLRTAPTERAGFEAEQAMWAFWSEAPDERSQIMRESAVERVRAGDLEGAQTILEALVDYCPDYSEGWNQLATVQFLRNRPDASLETIHRVLELEPAHFGALAGRTMILIRQGRVMLARRYLDEAIEIHPWIRARHMLPEVPGDDL